ncbi:MAG TPA: hypothetical protein DER09_03045 [Prolixibacteraceae bacterium]|nr:hypothetical protein [Prolixibacteraceae bacterium]
MSRGSEPVFETKLCTSDGVVFTGTLQNVVQVRAGSPHQNAGFSNHWQMYWERSSPGLKPGVIQIMPFQGILLNSCIEHKIFPPFSEEACPTFRRGCHEPENRFWKQNYVRVTGWCLQAPKKIILFAPFFG